MLFQILKTEENLFDFNTCDLLHTGFLKVFLQTVAKLR